MNIYFPEMHSMLFLSGKVEISLNDGRMRVEWGQYGYDCLLTDPQKMEVI